MIRRYIRVDAVINIMNRKLRVLDLFAGEKGWSQAFADAGHEVVTVEINPAQNPTIVAEITKHTQHLSLIHI